MLFFEFPCLEAAMAWNTGDDYRKGSVDDRTQVFNPKTEIWTKRDTDSGRFMQGKEDHAPFKGVAKETDHRRKHQ
jgi:hypothetical protein